MRPRHWGDQSRQLADPFEMGKAYGRKWMTQILSVLSQHEAQGRLSDKRGQLAETQRLTRFGEGMLAGAGEVLSGRK